MDQQSDKKEIDATIALGASLSDAVIINGFTPVGIQVPAAWTAAPITILASWDGIAFAPVYFQGVEYTLTGIPTVGGAWTALDPRAILGAMQLKIQSGPTSLPVVQAAERILKVISRGW